MNKDPLATLHLLLEAMNAHDADTVAALMTDDVSFWEPTCAEPRLGREAVCLRKPERQPARCSESCLPQRFFRAR